MVGTTGTKVRWNFNSFCVYRIFSISFFPCSIVVYEGGDVVLQARSLWRLELARTKWAGGFINWLHPMRIRHITTGRYLGVNENKELCLLARFLAFSVLLVFFL